MRLKLSDQNAMRLLVVIYLFWAGSSSDAPAQAPEVFPAFLPVSAVKAYYVPTNKLVRLEINDPARSSRNYWPEFDVFVTTNAAAASNGLDAINWSWLRRTTFGETNLLLPNVWMAKPYFLLGTILNTDWDSLPDAFEIVVSKTNPNLRDSDHNGIEDSDEFGMNGLPWALEQVRQTVTVAYVSKPTATEGGSCGQFTVRLPNPAPVGGALVQYRLGGTASYPNEFTVSPTAGSITIPAGGNSGNIIICAVNNTSYEELDRYVEITLTNCSTSRVFEYSARVEILDNDLPAVRVFPIPPRLDEPSPAYGTNAGEFYFIRDGNAATPVTVSFSFGGNGKSGVNYAALPRTINFPASVRTVSLPIRPLRDSKSQEDRTVRLSITGAQGYQVDPENGVAVVTIVNHDRPPLPVVQVVATIRHATVSTPGQFTFSRYGTTNEALRVYYGVEGETIVAYQNGKPVISYRGLPGYVDIPARQRTVTVPVIPVTPPPNGVTVTVTVRAEGDYSVGPARMAVVQIGKP